MGADRLHFAITQGGLSVPDGASAALVGAQADPAWSRVDLGDVTVVQTSAVQTAAWAALGVRTCLDWPAVDWALVTLPPARALAEARIAQASARLPKGALIVVDGDKACGVESVLKSSKGRVPVLGQVSKAHGKVFWFENAPVFDDWQAVPREVAPGFHTLPGVFSADGPDPASKLLLSALPDSLPGVIADLGAGWGYLSAHLLQRSGVQRVHLVEDDRTALDCAQANLHDARAKMHWADATTWISPELMDAVVMNPPFHAGKKGDPALGRAFIRAARQMLRPSGALWMVANRHLPYESELTACFRKVTELPGAAGFKIFHASHPLRGGRSGA